jgi:single-strand DNA-binding protein
MSVNKAIIVGNLGADPEAIASGDGCKFSVATTEKWTDNNGQKQERTEWHQIVCWGKTASNCMKYLAKGRQVYVEGSIQTREWEDDNGVTRYSTEVKAFRVQFLSGGDGQNGGNRQRRQQPSPGNPAGNQGGGGDDFEMPF